MMFIPCTHSAKPIYISTACNRFPKWQVKKRKKNVSFSLLKNLQSTKVIAALERNGNYSWGNSSESVYYCVKELDIKGKCEFSKYNGWNVRKKTSIYMINPTAISMYWQSRSHFCFGIHFFSHCASLPFDALQISHAKYSNDYIFILLGRIFPSARHKRRIYYTKIINYVYFIVTNAPNKDEWWMRVKKLKFPVEYVAGNIFHSWLSKSSTRPIWLDWMTEEKRIKLIKIDDLFGSVTIFFLHTGFWPCVRSKWNGMEIRLTLVLCIFFLPEFWLFSFLSAQHRKQTVWMNHLQST